MKNLLFGARKDSLPPKIGHSELQNVSIVGRLFGSRKERVPFVHKRRAFTLIELLVVIAIMVLLLAILMPSLQRARKQAKATICLHNLSQWGAIWLMYTDDWNGYFHPGWGGNDPGLPNLTGHWPTAIRLYYTDPKIQLCPEAPGPGKGAWGPSAFGEYVSYGLNGWVCNPMPDVKSIFGPTRWNWRTPHVKGANRAPLFLDAKFKHNWPDHREEPPEYEGVWAGHMGNFCINRHNGAINGVFLDFTVRKIGLKELWKLKWHREFDTNAGPTEGEWPDWMKNSKE